LADDQKVPRILNSFKNAHIRNWITTNREALKNLPFPDFVKNLREEFLPPRWEDNIRSKLLGSKMPKSSRFITWAREVQTENYLLRNTPSFLSDDRLRDTLEANVDQNLRLLATDIPVATRENLNDWLNQMEKLDEKLKLDQKRQRDWLVEELRSSKRQATHSARPSRNDENSMPTSSGYLPPLTVEERNLLRDHNGCYKCRKFYLSLVLSFAPSAVGLCLNFRDINLALETRRTWLEEQTNWIWQSLQFCHVTQRVFRLVMRLNTNKRLWEIA